MKQLTIIIIFGLALSVQSQTTPKHSTRVYTDKDIVLKIGGNYYTNNKKTIVYREFAILSISGNDSLGRNVNFEILNSQGKVEARMLNGEFTGGKGAAYALMNNEQGFAVKETNTGRPVLMVKYQWNEEKKRKEQNVWADFYLPDGKKFICTPETTNLDFMQYMKGAEFEGNDVAIHIK